MEITEGKSFRERAYETAIEILENHEPYPLPGNAPETIKAIIEEFETELKKDKYF